MDNIVEMRNIRKEFPGVVALDDITFDVRPGEVHLLLGENGAGKSTLMKILSGVYQPTSGSISINGKEFKKLTPKESLENGISIIFQELSVVNELSIMENLFVGEIPTRKTLGIKTVDYKTMKKRAEEIVKKVGLNKPISTRVEYLSISEKQLVEIAKALNKNARVVIMDEPTSSLTIEESEMLFRIIKTLKEENVGIVYISHKLQELRGIGDRVTILKDGVSVTTKNMSEIESEEEIISLMVGRELKNVFLNTQKTEKTADGSREVIFQAEHIQRKDKKVNDVSFEVYKNEILGFAGLVGSGRTELMNTIFAGENYESGTIRLNGKPIKIHTPYRSIKNEIAMVTESRRETGIFPNFGIKENIVLVNRLKKSKAGGFIGLIHDKEDTETAREMSREMQVKCASLKQGITELSGGNQQKVIIAKWLAIHARLIIFDEPTKGIDVGTKAEIYSIMRKLADEGIGVIMISSEMPELLISCDRIVVFGKGCIKGILTAEEANEKKILSLATDTDKYEQQLS